VRDSSGRDDLVGRELRPASQAVNIPRDVGHDVDVQHGAGDEGERNTCEGKDGDDHAGEQQVAQQPRECADVTLAKDLVLVNEGRARIRETKLERRPRAGVDPSDDEVIEVDENADGGAVEDNDASRNRHTEEFDRSDREHDEGGDDE
jgi:hypothetical protein